MSWSLLKPFGSAIGEYKRLPFLFSSKLHLLDLQLNSTFLNRQTSVPTTLSSFRACSSQPLFLWLLIFLLPPMLLVCLPLQYLCPSLSTRSINQPKIKNIGFEAFKTPSHWVWAWSFHPPNRTAHSPHCVLGCHSLAKGTWAWLGADSIYFPPRKIQHQSSILLCHLQINSCGSFSCALAPFRRHTGRNVVTHSIPTPTN